MKVMITSLHSYTYSVWKSRNDILHKDSEKSLKVLRRQKLQTRTADLYKRGRANLTIQELNHFKLHLEQRLRKGTESLTIWIKLIEVIFKRRGQARQEKMDTWLTQTTPEKNWKDRHKHNKMTQNTDGHRTWC